MATEMVSELPQGKETGPKLPTGRPPGVNEFPAGAAN